MKSLTGLAIGAVALIAASTTAPLLAHDDLMQQVGTKVGNKAHAGAIAKRRMEMHAISDNIKTIGSYLKASKGGPADVVKSALDIAKIAKTVPSLFPDGTGMARYPGVTGAKPEIFSDNAGYKKAADMMAAAAANLAKVATGPNAGKMEIGTAFGAVGKSCGSCHKVYRQKLRK